MKNTILYLLSLLMSFSIFSCSDEEIEKKENTPPINNEDNKEPNIDKSKLQIYLCFGQSNMEGNGTIEDVDLQGVSSRFKVMGTTAYDETHNSRKMGEWYTATPPLCRWNTGLTPVDYFGRKLVENLPSDVNVGVIVVAVAGCGIDAFDKDNYLSYYNSSEDWLKGIMDAYDRNPYERLVTLAKKAQETGVIKGILLHQGESNNMQQDWPTKLKKIHADLMKDLNLIPDSVPLLIGEMLDKDQGGACWGMNETIATVPQKIVNAHVISSKDCPGKDDHLHFTADGYRKLGRRYADKMLTLLGIRNNNLSTLKVSGRYLKDEDGKIVNLHGFAQTYSPWFNEEGRIWSNYDVAACLRYNQGLIDRILSAGWKMDFVRLHMDPYWSNQPGVQVKGENDISAFSMERFKKYLDEVFVPMAKYANSKGMYVVMRPPGVCPENIYVGDKYQQYLIDVWSVVAQHKDLQNNPGIMFELANEPIRIKGRDGSSSLSSDDQFKEITSYFQTIVNAMRTKGANNILWIPGLGYQAEYRGFKKYPIQGENIGYAVHVYPGWFNSGSGYEAFQIGWDEQVKPTADFAPIMVTEMDWAPEKYNASWGRAETGVVGGEGFGANFKYIVDNSGNVSWLLFTGPNLLADFKNVPGVAGAYTFLNDPEACPWPIYHWFQDYADNSSGIINSALDRLEIVGLTSTSISILTGGSRSIILKAYYKNGSEDIVTSKATYVSSATSVVSVSDGKIKALKDGKATITISFKGAMGDTKSLTLNVTASTFPLTADGFNPNIWEKGTFNPATNTLVTGQYGFGGWQYSEGVNLSSYKRLTVELGNDNTSQVSFRLFDTNNYWSSPAMYDFGSSRKITIDLHSMVRDSDKSKVDPSHLYIIGFWSLGGKDIVIKSITLEE